LFEILPKDMSDEAHFSAKQSGSRPSARVSVADGDAGRTRGDSRPSCARPQEAVGLTSIRKRSDFLAANAASRVATPGFVLLVRLRGDGNAAKRLGITVTKKIGSAVIRNRMKRRFRELAREVIAPGGLSGADHVLIGRAGGVERDYTLLKTELGKALGRAIRGQ
jgi:ribonuclease P protein component